MLMLLLDFEQTLSLALEALSTLWLMEEGKEEEWERGRRVELTSSPLLKKAFVPRPFVAGLTGVSFLGGTFAGPETPPAPVKNFRLANLVAALLFA